MAEIWLPIKDYEGLYEVSNLGRVRSLDRKVRNRGGFAIKKGKIISDAAVSDHKYRKVGLWKDNVGKNALVHRLVAEAFLDNPNNLPEVNHKDENPENNCVDNLEWCDSYYNMHYGTGAERRADKRRGKPIGSQPILQYSKDGELLARYDSALEAAKAINGDNSAICKCANGKVKTSYGCVWKWEQ
jgi:hypothetical protein